MIYKLMCFIYLSDIEEIIIPPGVKYGTKKTGHMINEIRTNITIINSRWNVSSVKSEGFAVAGHFRLQPFGEGRTERRIQWIDPFEKTGYNRKATKEIANV